MKMTRVPTVHHKLINKAVKLIAPHYDFFCVRDVIEHSQAQPDPKQILLLITKPV